MTDSFSDKGVFQVYLNIYKKSHKRWSEGKSVGEKKEELRYVCGKSQMQKATVRMNERMTGMQAILGTLKPGILELENCRLTTLGH